MTQHVVKAFGRIPRDWFKEDLCDESKCVSSSDMHLDSFTCYGDYEFHPMMCADGYLPRIVEAESPIVRDDIPLQYFTCCPPNLPTETVPARHCSDPVVTRLKNENYEENHYTDDDTGYCDNEYQPYYRRMKSRRRVETKDVDNDDIAESHMCCDSVLASDENDNSTIANDFLQNTECVPYHNVSYSVSRVRNKYGMIEALTCDLLDGEYDFDIPRLSNTTSRLSSTFSYECCRSGDPPPPFVGDLAFGLTIYPQIILSSIAVVSSVVIIVGLSIPLFLQLFRKDKVIETRTPSTIFRNSSKMSHDFSQKSDARSQTSNSNVNNIMNSGSLELSRMSLRRSSQIATGAAKKKCKYSTYNLYLVYLAIPDLIMNLYLLGMYGSYASNRTFNHNLCGFIINEDSCSADEDGVLFTSILSGYWTANIYLNALVAYEVYALLRNSKNFQRHSPPSIRQVNFQAIGVCLLSVAVTISYYCLSMEILEAEARGASDLASKYDIIKTVLLNTLLLGFVPIIFFPSVCLLIWRRGLMPSTTPASGGSVSPRDRALRELAWYFLRIVAVFGCCWIPIAILSAVGGSSRFSIIFLVLALQQILSTCVSLTKSDVRKHLADAFCLCRLCRVDSKSQDSSESAPASTVVQPPMSDLIALSSIHSV